MKRLDLLVVFAALAGSLVSCGGRTPTAEEYSKAYRSTMEACEARQKELGSQPLPDRTLPRPQLLEQSARRMEEFASSSEDGVKRLRALRYPPQCKEMNDASIELLTMMAGSFRRDAADFRAGRRLGSDAQLRSDLVKVHERLIQAMGRAGIDKQEMDRLRALSAELLRQ
jgi:hypothetical protein